MDKPHTVAIQPATESYGNLEQWEEIVPVKTIVTITEGLLAGEYDSVLTSLELAEKYPERFRVDQHIGTVDDAWLAFGKRRISDGDLVAWPTSPISKDFAQK